MLAPGASQRKDDDGSTGVDALVHRGHHLGDSRPFVVLKASGDKDVGSADANVSELIVECANQAVVMAAMALLIFVPPENGLAIVHDEINAVEMGREVGQKIRVALACSAW